MSADLPPDSQEEPTEALETRRFVRSPLNPKTRGRRHAVLEPAGDYPSFDQFCVEASEDEIAGFFRGVVQLAESMQLGGKGYRVIVHNKLSPGARFCVEIQPPAPPPTSSWQLSGPPAYLDGRTLILVPLPGLRRAGQARLLGDALGFTQQVASRLLDSNLPQPLKTGGGAELSGLARRLEGFGIPVACLETQRIVETFNPWRVQGLERDGGALYAVGDEGRVGLEAREGLLVRGVYSWIDSSRGEKPPSRGSTKMLVMKRARFGHLYFTGNPRPFSFVESEPWDYGFLGEKQTPSAEQNFGLLLDELVANLAVAQNGDLANYFSRVPETGERFWAGLPAPTTSSPSTAADVLSRVLFYLATEPDSGLEPAPQEEGTSSRFQMRQTLISSLAEDPSDVALWLKLGKLHLECAAPEAALAAFHEATDRAPDSFEAWYGVGLASAGHDPSKAVAAYDRALEIDPKSASAHYQRGRASEGLGARPNALKDYFKAVDLDPEATGAWRALGRLLRADEEFEDAVATFRRSTAEMDDEETKGWPWQAEAMLEADQERQAIESFLKSLTVDRSDEDEAE